MYHPCKSNSPLSTYQQHLCTLGHLKRDTYPQVAILDDLAKELHTWQDAGDVIVVAADFNEDIWSDTLCTFFGQFGLKEVLSTLHRPGLPASHNCGSLPINGFFVPAGLIHFCHVGYLDFSEGVPSDHWASWLDIPADLLNLSPEDSPAKAQTYHLQCSDPQVILQYNSLLHQRLTDQNIFSCTSSLLQSISGTCLTKTQLAEYEAIDQISVETKRFAWT